MESIKFRKENIKFRKESRIKEIWRRFKKGKAALIGLVILVIILVLLFSAELLIPYEKAIEQNISIALDGPSKNHIFGCDIYGRDILARVVHGGRTSLGIAFWATICSCVVGCILGAISGYFGGWVDSIIMRGLDIFMSVPDILFTMAVVFALGANFVNLLIAITISFFPNYVRLVRSQVLTLSEQDYVEACKAGGSSSLRVIFSHMLPNAIGVIIVNVTLNIGRIILYESTLGFLGLGIAAPQPEWGMMLSEARDVMRTAPHMLIFPAIAIVICACSINLVGDGLRDALDPHLKS